MDGALTYAEFDARTDEVAAGLADLGVKPGDVVSVVLPNGPSSSRRGGRSCGWAGSQPVNPASPAPRPASSSSTREAVAS